MEDNKIEDLLALMMFIDDNPNVTHFMLMQVDGWKIYNTLFYNNKESDSESIAETITKFIEDNLGEIESCTYNVESNYCDIKVVDKDIEYRLVDFTRAVVEV